LLRTTKRKQTTKPLPKRRRPLNVNHGSARSAQFNRGQFPTSIQGIVVQARDGDMRLWAYPIDRREAGGAGIVVPTPLPLPPAPPPSSDASDLVQPRKKPDGKDETDKSEK
jgi:hypothetical protein